MANDRVFLRCPVCKDMRLIYKYYPAGGYSTPERLTERGDFADDHIHGCGNIFAGDMGDKPFLELVTESGVTADEWAAFMKRSGVV